MRDLIVDDQRSSARIIATILNGFQLRPTHVRTVAEAIERLRQIKPVLVTTGLNTNELGDGLDVIRAVRQYDNNIPVIVVSGSIDARNRRKARRLGADYCLKKPVDVFRFCDAVQKVLGHR